jgi:chromosomal replication initiator protein DnaA
VSESTTVFISYSRESDEHVSWVSHLANAVEQIPGLHVVFDQYELHAGRDLTEFMDRGLACDRIVVIITPEYVRRAEGRIGGVGYESSVISAGFVTDQLSDRCVPILREGTDRPSFLRSKIYVDFRAPITFYEELRRLREALLRITPSVRPSRDVASSSDLELPGSGESSLFGRTAENPAYTFNSFLVSAESELAFSACVAVAEAPRGAVVYNPLFLYGPVGCGKTHLLHAIANRMRAQQPELNILRMRTETLIERLSHAIRYDKLLQFKQELASLDALLLDDIEYVGGRELVQQEIFSRFSEFLLRDAQLVVTSTVHPREIRALSDRVMAQLQGGLITSVGYPDGSALMQLARNVAISKGTRLPDDALKLIISRTGRGPREVESAVTRVAAEKGLSGPADVDVRSLIRRLFPK